MNDLDRRLRNLGSPDEGGSAGLHARAATLRSRATARRRRRNRRAVGVVVASVAVLAGVAVAAFDRDAGTEDVATGPDTTDAPSGPTTTAEVDPSDEVPSIGGLEGLTIDVTPRTDLVDGQLVEVRIEGLELLESPVLVLCAGDLAADTAAADCDLRQLERADDPDDTSGAVVASQTVAVRRTIQLGREGQDPNAGGSFDCATEPVGCVMAIGSTTDPTRSAIVPVTFDADAPVPTPEVRVVPSAGLRAEEDVEVTASGLRPNSTFRVAQCSAGRPQRCDEMSWPVARTDADGNLTAVVPARPALYDWQGKIDCTESACTIVVTDDSGERYAAAAIAFAGDVTAPMPSLQLSPAGPYVDGQEVTLTGQGFPAGADIGSQIGQCPDDLDTAVADRCTRPAIGRATVDDDGTFTVTIRLADSLLYTGTCTGDPGCHIGWVLPHGPTQVKAPLDFAG